MQQDRENTRPEERYDPSNPLWSGQQVVAQMHPQTMRMEYYSLNYRTKARYWHAKYHKCLLYSHVKWMCPHSICTNCGQTCGKSPFRCKKDSQNRAEEVIGSSSRNMEPPAYDATPTTIQPSIASQTMATPRPRRNSHLPPDMRPGRILPYPCMTTQPHRGPPRPRRPRLSPPPQPSSPPYEDSFSDHDDLYGNGEQ